MTHPKVAMNGIDPMGVDPPDELVHHPDDGEAVELTRQSRPDGWAIRRESDGPNEARHFEDFEVAFAQFAYHVADGQGML